MSPKKLGTNQNEIEVRSGEQQEISPESYTNIKSENITSLPINRGNTFNLSLLAPRVTVDRTPVQGISLTSGLSFNAQSARANSIIVDGVDNNSSLTGAFRSNFSQNTIQEFQIVSDSFSSEFGRALGGIINIITKGGTKDFHGNVFSFLRNDESSAKDPFLVSKPNYQQYQFGTSLSGPIMHNSDFFVSFERLSVKQNNIINIDDITINSAQNQGFNLRNGAVAFPLANTSLLTRIDFRPNKNLTLNLRYNFGGVYNGAFEPFGNNIEETNGGILKLADNALGANLITVNSNASLINETRFLFSQRNRIASPLSNTTQVQLLAPKGNIQFGRNDNLPLSGEENFYQLVNITTLPLYKSTAKFGIDFLYNSINTQVPILANGLSIFTPIDFSALTGIAGLPAFNGLESFDPKLRTPEQRNFLNLLANILPQQLSEFPSGVPLADLALPQVYLQGFASQNGISSSAKFLSLFLQDDIKLRPNLLLKLGIRYDLNRVTFFPKNKGNISPRVSLSYQPNHLPKVRLQAAYGLFFGLPLTGTLYSTQPTNRQILVLPFPFSVLAFAQPEHHFPESAELPAGVTFIPQLSTTSVFQSDLRNSYSQQLKVGINYSFNQQAQFAANYTFVRGIKLFASRNTNPVVRPIVGDPINSAIFGRVDPSKGQIIELESGFDSYYHAITFSLEQKLTSAFNIIAHYTLSKAIDNTIDFRGSLQEQVNPLNISNERGLSLQDIRSRFVASASWDIKLSKNPLLSNYQLAFIVDLQSGRPFNLLTGVDLDRNGDTPPADRPLGLGRNVGITPGFATTDLRLSRQLKLTSEASANLFVEVFNLFNRVNISDVNRFFPPDSEGNIILPPQQRGRYIALPERYRSAFSPRQVQFGVRLTF